MTDYLKRFILHLSKINPKSYREVLRTTKFVDNMAAAFSSKTLDYERICAAIDENTVVYNNMISIGYNWLLCLAVLYRTNGYKPADKTAAYNANLIVENRTLIDERYVNVAGFLKANNIYSTKMFSSSTSTMGEYFCRKLLECPAIAQRHFSEFILVFMRKVWVRQYGYKTIHILSNYGLDIAS